MSVILFKYIFASCSAFCAAKLKSRASVAIHFQVFKCFCFRFFKSFAVTFFVFFCNGVVRRTTNGLPRKLDTFDDVVSVFKISSYFFKSFFGDVTSNSSSRYPFVFSDHPLISVMEVICNLRYDVFSLVVFINKLIDFLNLIGCHFVLSFWFPKAFLRKSRCIFVFPKFVLRWGCNPQEQSFH